MRFCIIITTTAGTTMDCRDYKTWARAEYYTASEAQKRNADHWEIRLMR